jgi:hypothetical protein
VIVMEYRVWITVPGLGLADEHRWKPAIQHLERTFAQYGPVIGWEQGETRFVLSTEAPSELLAARDLYSAVVETLRRTSLTDLYPTRVEIEPASEARAPAAA